MGETANRAEFAAGLESQYSQGLRDDHSLLLVVWWWDTFKHLQSLHSLLAALGLVWDHASYGLVEDAGRGAEMEWTASGRVVSSDLSQVGVVLDCIALCEQARGLDLWLTYA